MVLQHYQRVDHALRDYLGDDRAPLVLAGVRYAAAEAYSASDGTGLTSGETPPA
jgi:hypothetical protein